jgi:hypothetical protein
MVGGSVENTLTGVFFCFFSPMLTTKLEGGYLF